MEDLMMDDRGMSPEQYEAHWNQTVDSLFRQGLRPAEEPHRWEKHADGFVSWYRLVAVGAALMLGLVVSAGSASAEPISPNPGHVARTYSPSPVQKVHRTWHGTPWTPTRTYTAPPQTRAPLWVRVASGDTLWGLAETYRGSGYEWQTIAALNGISGTTIYAGSLLRVR